MMLSIKRFGHGLGRKGLPHVQGDSEVVPLVRGDSEGG